MILVNLALVILLVVALNVSFFWKHRKRKQHTWEELVAALQPVALPRLEIVARHHLRLEAAPLALESDQVWELLGGFEGLERLRTNASLMIELAAHVARWNSEEGTIVCEWIRHDAVALRRAVLRIEIAHACRKFYPGAWLRHPFHLNEAASAYYVMRQRLLALYENNHAAFYPRLAEAL
ncbi:MAG: hypothetical protein ACR2JE_15875 [Acidobacteriaceae bacterium]